MEFYSEFSFLQEVNDKLEHAASYFRQVLILLEDDYTNINMYVVLWRMQLEFHSVKTKDGQDYRYDHYFGRTIKKNSRNGRRLLTTFFRILPA